MKTIIEDQNHILYKVGKQYFLKRKKDREEVSILKDKVEDFVMWGKKEFLKECKTVSFSPPQKINTTTEGYKQPF